jgi:hypothetical protein
MYRLFKLYLIGYGIFTPTVITKYALYRLNRENDPSDEHDIYIGGVNLNRAERNDDYFDIAQNCTSIMAASVFYPGAIPFICNYYFVLGIKKLNDRFKRGDTTTDDDNKQKKEG